MSTTAKSTIANTILVGIFLSMMAGIASWNVDAIKGNTKAVLANTGMVYENREKNQEQHEELAGLIIGVNYEIEHLNHDCAKNTLDIADCQRFHYRPITIGEVK